jgi:uncharacterized membrane protein
MMSADDNKRNSANRPVTGSLHPRVYTVLIGLALWMALWVWSFVGGGETDYILFIVTGFIVVVVALQLVLMRVRRADKTVDDANSAEDNKDGALSLQQWARGEFEAERGRLRAAEAALLILLPIAAAAIGMMAFGIEFQIVERAAGM